MNRRRKTAGKTSGPAQASSLPVPRFTSYEDAVQGADQPRMTKVSVTVDRGLLSLVDHYVQCHTGTNRSEIFDKALALWAKEIQRQADIDCYATGKARSEQEQQAAADWASIQVEAAKQIW